MKKVLIFCLMSMAGCLWSFGDVAEPVGPRQIRTGVGHDIDVYREMGVYDPIQGANRCIFEFNDVFIMWGIRPVARIYERVLPTYVRSGLSRMTDSVRMPSRLISMMIQAHFKNAGLEFTRFLINSTAGIGGFYDPAERWCGIKYNYEDFGTAFAAWGIGPGPYVVLPVQGGSNIRDGVGLIFDTAADPIFWVSFFLPLPVGSGINGGVRLNNASLSIRQYEQLRTMSRDPYETFRDTWYLLRKYQLMDDKLNEK